MRTRWLLNSVWLGLAVSLPVMAFASETERPSADQAPSPPSAVTQPEPGVVAAVDLRYVASRSKSGRTAFARLDELARRKQTEIEARSRALEEQQQKLRQDPSFLGDNVEGQLARAFERATIELDRFREDAEAEVVGLQRQIEAEFSAKVSPVIDAVARERGLQFVFDVERAAIVWRSPVADISDEVVQRLDAEPN